MTTTKRPDGGELKRNQVLSFDDGLLTIRISGHGEGNGWGSIAFHERQIEIDPDGFHAAEIPPSELLALRDFLNRVLPSTPANESPAPQATCAWLVRYTANSADQADCFASKVRAELHAEAMKECGYKDVVLIPLYDAPQPPVEGLISELRAASEGLHLPPSIQSQRNIRAMNAMDKAANALASPGLREALRAKINEMNILVREYDTSNPDWAFRSGVMLTVLTNMCRDLGALASPPLTAVQSGQKT